MNESTSRALLVAGLSANVLFLTLALLDHSAWESQYQWPIFVGWAVLIILIVVLALASSGVRVEVVRRVVEARPAPPAAAPAPRPAPAAAPAPAPKPLEPVPFTFNGYTLHTRDVVLKNGGKRTIWFFSKRRPASGTPAAKPAGFHVGVNERTGLPFLKKGGGADGEDLTPATPTPALRPQCGALTEDDKQCRNSARTDSKYCASHFGYQPPVMAKAEAARKDTRARVRDAPDTVPAVRRRTA